MERRPATEAVAMKLPDEAVLEDDVFLMAGTACLAAKKTLEKTSCQHRVVQ